MSTKNLFAILDSDDEETPRQVKQTPVEDNKAQRPVKNGKTNKVVAREAEKERNDNKRGARGGRGGRGGRHTRRRDFDRRSGSGRGHETKKQGGGAHNWGSEKNETELANEAQNEEQTKSSSEEEVEEVVEEENNEMTLDEYLAMKETERCGDKFAALEIRKVENEFANAKEITKDGKTGDFMEAKYEKIHRERVSGRKKQIFQDVGFRASNPNEFRRGGRNSGYAQRRGGRRGGRSHAPNVSDLSAFPTLA